MIRRIPALMRRGGRSGVSGGVVWSPLDLSPAGYYVANSDATSTGTWADLSGNGNDLTAIAGERGTYNATGVGGKPCIDLDGVDDVFLNASFALGSTTGMSIIWIGRFITRTSGSRPICYNSSSGYPRVLEFASSWAWYGTLGSPSLGNASALADKVNTLTIKVSGTNTVYEGETLINSGAESADALASTATFSFGAYFNGSLPGNLRAAEVIVMPTQITAPERTALAAYALAEYGIT